MSDKKEKNKGAPSTPFEGSSCMDIMAKMMDQSGEGVSCESIISKFMNEDEIPSNWLQQIAKMGASMSSCCGTPTETEKE
jgi:hypothetical protein